MVEFCMHISRTFGPALAVLVIATLSTVDAQTPEPKSAFPGQTDAPPPTKPSAPFIVQQLAGGLPGAWSFAFLPDGHLLVTQNVGTMRIVRPDGVVSAPMAGVPGVKSVAAQGLHDVLLDPDFARNRILYFTYFG
jgi:aldose sugar dehydrogenase